MNTFRPDEADYDFSLEHYRQILRCMKTSHELFSFRKVHELKGTLWDIERFVIMRHDVEVDLGSALQLAQIDASEGVTSTFFLLYSGDYNIFSENGSNIVREILTMGHDIGLHYDVALMEVNQLDITEVLTRQVELMESYFQTRIYAMSSHMPMRSGATYSVRDVLDTYDPRFMKQVKYLSDSTQKWREGVVTGCLHRFNKIHLLTHEYIWDSEARDWDTLLLLSAKRKFDAFWNNAVNDINRFRQGLKMRQQKDAEFKKRFL